MKKKFIILLLTIAKVFSSDAQTITIAAARSLPVGSTVTINGIVINGNELGTIRYIQDATDGIAIFSNQLNSVNRGDNITVTGVLDDYNNLLEINPINSWILNSSGNTIPNPLLISPLQLDEPKESHLVRINGVTFANGGGTFGGNATYNFSSNGQNGVVYVRGGSPLIGLTIPATNVSLIGICSQFINQYQFLLRDSNDIISSSSIAITVPPYPSNINNSGLDINWSTNLNGSTFIKYGHTPLLELGILNGTGGNTSHNVNITGANASELFYVQAYSVAGNDTAFSNVELYMTASNSTGIIKTYFNRSVDHSVANSPSNYAVQLNHLIADTLSAYLNRAQNSIDIAIYNFDTLNTSAIINALNAAFNNGITIRIIIDGNNQNAALNQLNPGIPILLSPDNSVNFYYNIMHNKFVIIDANASNPDLPIVWTGSTNWTDGQLNTDANNVVIFQDQSLAKAYTMEFEEMWGSNTTTPNPVNSKFGPDKTDNTPHEFNIGGKRVESYFSPSDDVNNQILKTIGTANSELYIALYVFTRFDLANGIQNIITANGVYSAGVIDDSSNGGGTAFNIIYPLMGNNLQLYDHASLPGILHHKYMIIDQGNSSSDPLVLTGSHNWSSNANLKNDENTVIVHDENIANQYYQEFIKRHHDNGGTVGLDSNSFNSDFDLYPNPSFHEFSISSEQFVIGEKVPVKIWSSSGSAVFNDESYVSSNKTVTCHLSNKITPGIYFVMINGTVKKFIKQ